MTPQPPDIPPASGSQANHASNSRSPKPDRTLLRRIVAPIQSLANSDAVQVPLQRVGDTWDKGGRWLGQWFQVDEQKVQAILEEVRQSLPTTEVLLIGKAQTGKSSIIRALTGATADIIGQGFRPHTAHTQIYAYPTADLPLLNFIDTVGLGEGLRDPKQVAAELNGILAQSTRDQGQRKAAQILVVTVKVTDFAVDSLFNLVSTLRQAYPHIPCLLAVTCLHELYPQTVENHPTYPPEYSELTRAVQALQEQFQSVGDRVVCIDFTLEEDGYTPVLYGLEAFVRELAGLLPAAEAQMINQLIDQAEVGDQLSEIYREAGRRYILPFSIMAATAAAVPLPFATMPVLTALQATLVTLLGRLYGQSLSLSQAGGVTTAIAGGFVAQMIGRELIKFIPGLGSVVAASWAAAYTWALGEGACVYFGDLMGGKTPDPEVIQETMREAFKSAQERFKNSLHPDH